MAKLGEASYVWTGLSTGSALEEVGVELCLRNMAPKLLNQLLDPQLPPEQKEGK